MARLYYRVLKDLGVFAPAEERAHDARAAADAKSRRDAAAAEKAKQDAERQTFERAGLPYHPASATASKTTSPAAVAPSKSRKSGFVETTGADLADKGVGGLKEILFDIKKAGGGVLFVDEVRHGVGPMHIVGTVTSHLRLAGFAFNG